MAAAPDPLPDEEFVYRRILWNHYDNPASSPYPRIEAFRPGKNDVEGISVDRAQLTGIDRVSRGRSVKPYHVARLNVGSLRSRLNLVVIPDPIPAGNLLGLPPNPAHALIPGLSRTAYDRDKPGLNAMIDVIVTEIAQLVLVALNPDVFPWQD